MGEHRVAGDKDLARPVDAGEPLDGVVTAKIIGCRRRGRRRGSSRRGGRNVGIPMATFLSVFDVLRPLPSQGPLDVQYEPQLVMYVHIPDFQFQEQMLTNF